MKHIFTCYDSKAEIYLTPFFEQTRGSAMRAWMQICTDPQTQFNKFPGDYTLFEIGTFDEHTGNISLYSAKINLGLALDMIPKAQSAHVQNQNVHPIQNSST